MKKIKLTQGKYAIVDDSDFEFLSQWSWFAAKLGNTFYAVRKKSLGQGLRKTVWMHREVIKTPDKMFTDHIDGNGLNNCRNNLRVVSHTQNMHNRKIPITNKTGFKGVTFVKSTKKFRSLICVRGKQMHLGYYDTAEEAARVYNESAAKHCKEFARLNNVLVC